jgi:hypothetical protein
MLKKTVLLLFHLFILFSCSKDSKQLFEQDCFCDDSCKLIPLRHKSTIDISVNRLQYDYDLTSIYDDSGKVQFWGYNRNEMKFYVYDVFGEALIDTIQIASNGEHAVPNIYGFKVITPDSILVHTNEYNELILIDTDAKKIKTWKIRGDLPNKSRLEGLYYLTVVEDYNYFYYDKTSNRATFLVLNMGFEGAHPIERFFYPQFVELDLQKESYTSIYGDYPSAYRQEDKLDYEFLFPFSVVEDQTWATFNSSHCIYVFTKDKYKQSFCAKSRFMPAHFDLLPRGLKAGERDPILIRRGHYGNIIYDKHREVFYRIVIHDLPESIPTNRDWEVKKRGAWSVMIINLKGECLGEVVFEAEKYDPRNVFPIKEGLLVSLENPYNKNNNEEMFSFALFSLDGL